MRIPLTVGSYVARSRLAEAQKTINLFPEKNPDDAPFPFSLYPTPGLTVLSTPTAGAARGLFTASNGALFGVVGNELYYIDPTWTHNPVATLSYSGVTPSSPVSMSDNGLCMVLVDGTANGYVVDLTGNTYQGTISDPAFFGADRVDFADTYFLFNNPGTAEFYISPSNYTFGNAFNSLWIASKTGGTDPIQGVVVMHLEPWLIGTETTEVWYDSGASDIPYEREPGIFVNHGAVGKYSFAVQDNSIFWISQNKQGERMVFEGAGYQAKRVSNHALENELAGYSTVADAVGMIYQQEGHVFYVLTFPTADKTWVYDLATGLWHQRAWIDTNGVFHRHRMGSLAAAYGTIVCQDWQTGQLYELDQSNYTDAGQAVVRVQSFPHMRNDGMRVSYPSFIADMEVGTTTDTGRHTDPTVPVIFTGTNGQPIIFTGAGPINWIGTSANEPAVSLRWSDDGGYSWGQPVTKGLGAQGNYLRTPTWRRTGMARRRVFELSWSFAQETVLNGAYVDAEPAGT